MKVQLLGQARVVLEPQSYPLALDKRGALLAYLAYAGDWVLRDQLAFLFWPDSEDAKAKSNLRQLLKRTKELPYSTTLETEADRLRWHVESDVTKFKQASEKQEWVKAVALYQGHLLENFAPPDSEGFLA